MAEVGVACAMAVSSCSVYRSFAPSLIARAYSGCGIRRNDGRVTQDNHAGRRNRHRALSGSDLRSPGWFGAGKMS